MTDHSAEIRTFLATYFRDYRLRDDEDIFAAGFVTSMFAIQMVQFIERQFGITIGTEDLMLDNFRTIDAVSRLIERKQGSAP